jgi:uncharacterized protein YjbI with pentapeptide repeats
LSEVNLRQRWLGRDGELLAGEVLDRLKAGRALGDLALGEVDGRVDLRGFPVALPRRTGREFQVGGLAIAETLGPVVIEGTRLRGLDLTGAFLDHLIIRDCTVEDCVLEKAHCFSMGFGRSCQVRDTSFRGANLREFGLGAWRDGKGCEYLRVDFTGADLRESGHHTAMFTDCDFSGASLDEVWFKLCGFVRCRFSGVLNETQFDGRVYPDDEGPNLVQDVDMSAAVLRHTRFTGFDLDGVTLPDEPGLRVIRDYPAVVIKARALLQGRQDADAQSLRQRLELQYRGRHPFGLRSYPLGLFNREDYARSFGEDGAVLADAIFREAERDCATGQPTQPPARAVVATPGPI